MQRGIPAMEALPDNDLILVLADLHALRNEITDGMTYHRMNYVVIRLVTVVERMLKYLVMHEIKNDEYIKNISIDPNTLRIALKTPGDPESTLRRIVAETYSFQNIKAVIEFTGNYKPKYGKKIEISKEKDDLDRLFKTRHRIVHTVDEIPVQIEDVRNFYDVVRQLLMRFVYAYTPYSEPYIEGMVLEKTGDKDGAMKFYRVAIQKHMATLQKEKCLSANECVELGFAYYNVGALESAVNLFKERAEKNQAPDFYCLWGLMLGGLEQDAEAVKRYGDGLQIKPDHTILQQQMGFVQLKLGKPMVALECALRTMSDPAAVSDSYLLLAGVFGSLGNESMAQFCTNRYKQYGKLIGRLPASETSNA